MINYDKDDLRIMVSEIVGWNAVKHLVKSVQHYVDGCIASMEYDGEDLEKAKLLSQWLLANDDETTPSGDGRRDLMDEIVDALKREEDYPAFSIDYSMQNAVCEWLNMEFGVDVVAEYVDWEAE